MEGEVKLPEPTFLWDRPEYPHYTADQLRQAVQEEREVSVRLRDLLRRTQTYVCSNRELAGASELCGEIAEAMGATMHLRAVAIRSGEGEMKG